MGSDKNASARDMTKKVAIVGYSFRLPQTSREQFWDDLLDSKNMISEIPEDRWSFENHLHPDKKHPGTSYTFKAGTLGDVSGFDAEFFGISPREAAVVDPQQRYLLELTWEAIEHAGIKPNSLKGTKTGVYLGMSSIDYAYRMADDLSCANGSTATGNTGSIAANRISYIFDLKGPSLSMDTACSSSLYAFHHACQAIVNGEVSTAITGGISLLLHPFGFVAFSKATMLSPDGECRFCDASANGYVRAEGGGIFLLKDYDKAIDDGDIIHAVIAGSAVNTDGFKSGITIPSWQSQQALMEQVYAKAGINPDEIDYLEAHGTGTPVGDPIETRAIGHAIGQQRKQPLYIGSIKANLGHLEPASGVAGLIKALHVLKHRAIPPTSSMKSPNPNILFDEWNIELADQLTPLKHSGQLTIGVNSFGFGGANAHVILQSHESPSKKASEKISTASKRLPWIITGKNQQAIQQNALKLSEALDQGYPLYDTAWHYANNKQRLGQGVVFFAETAEEVQKNLLDISEDKAPATIIQGPSQDSSNGPVFVYSGNGCQWEGMGSSLLQESDLFRNTIDEIDKIISKLSDFSIKQELALLNGKDRYDFTEIAQPTLFALQVGLTRYLESKGIKPVAVTGHSVGEVAAAWACGALSLADAVKVIYQRSFYQGKTKGNGAMAAISLSEKEVTALFSELSLDDLHIAGINSHAAVTVAGNARQLSMLEAHLLEKNIFHAHLPLDYAFHSPAMDDIQDSLLASLEGIKPKKSKIPFISTVTGQNFNTKKMDATYWWDNIREPVQFKDALDCLIADDHNCFIEIGAHPVLRHYLNEQIKSHQHDALIIPTQTRNNGELAELEQTTGLAILAQGCNLTHYFPVAGNKLELPTYAWQHEPYWFQQTSESHQILSRFPVHPLLGAPVPRIASCWESHINSGNHQWLAGHNVGGSIVLPGAAFAEIALNAGSLYQEAEIIELEDLEILSPLILDDELGKVVQTRVTQSGNIEIASRSYSIEENWRPHARAKAVHQPTGLALQKIYIPDLPNTPVDFDNSKHYALTKKAGLNYSGAFQSVAKGWNLQEGIFAKLGFPENTDTNLEEYFLHPGLLDSAIQLVIHELADQLDVVSGVAFVPISMAKISCLKQKDNPPAYALLKCLQHSPHSLLTNIELFDKHRNPIALIESLRYRAVKLTDRKQHLSYLDYHLIPAPRINKGIAVLPEKIHSVLSKSFYAYAENQKLYQHEFLPLIDSLVHQSLAEHLADFHKQQPDKFQKLSYEHPVIFDMAEHLGLINIEDDRLILNEDSQSGDISAELIWNTLTREYPDYFEETHLVGSFILTLGEQLNSDGINSTVNTDTTSIYNRYFKAHHGRYCQKSLQNIVKTVREIQNELDDGERFSICEIAGTRAYIAPSIIPELDFNHCDYVFYSPNESAVNQFNENLHHYPLATAELVTVEQDSSQSFNAPAPGYQLVIATLDTPDVQSVIATLKQAFAQMCDRATLLLSGISTQSWHSLVFGGTSPQLNSRICVALLEQNGFNNIRTITSDIDIEDFFILSASRNKIRNTDSDMATNDESVETGQCIFYGGNSQNEKLIKSSLNKSHADITIHAVSNISGLSETLGQIESENSRLDKIIFARGLGNPDNPFEHQAQRCGDLTEIHKLMQNAEHTPEVVVLTQNTGIMYGLPVETDTSAGALPSDAAIWGFARTLMNEAVSYAVRLIDIPDDLNLAVLNTLSDEIFDTATESEIFFDSNGQRFAPRLRLEKYPFSKDPLADQDKLHTTLQFDIPGQLKNLVWKSSPLNGIEDDQVEVEIKATGLNFRDVMYALGLLSDEAIENGFAGASLGLEFAGRISAVGKNVKKFNVNDRVVGFNSSCFSDRMVCPAETVVKVPFGVSYSSAATIPTTFLTVYYSLKHLARLQPGERVLIHGAAGGVGLAAIQVAQWIGAEIYATVGSKEKREYLTLLGVNNIYNSRDLAFADEIINDTDDNKGVDVVLNSLAGEAINLNLKILKPFGRFLELGKRDFYENTPIGLRPFRNNISYFGIDADQLQKELPELAKTMFEEVIGLFEKGELFPLPYTEFTAHEVISAFRYMQQAKQIGKVVITYPDQVNMKPTVEPAVPDIDIGDVQLNANYAYLITGGLGGFGLKTAQWLADQGARKLILLSRRGPSSEEAQEFIRYAEDHDITVHAVSCDVTDKQAVHDVYHQCSKEIAPIRGIIHAATVIDDDLAFNLNIEKITNSLNAKMTGAMHLHEASLKDPLDFFVLYSSVTTLWGNPGQASYVAANHWLEAFTVHRQNMGLPATCVRWGAIDDVGFLQRNEKIKSALEKRTGSEAIKSGDALDFLGKVLVKQRSTLGIMELNWGTLKKYLPTSTDSKFTEINLTAAHDEQDQDVTIDLKQLISEMGIEQFRQFIISKIRHELAQILMIAEDKIDPDQSIYDMGMDSLMGLELVTGLEGKLGIQIPVMALSETPRLNSLADKIIQLVNAGNEAEADSDTYHSVKKLADAHSQEVDDEELRKFAGSLESK